MSRAWAIWAVTRLAVVVVLLTAESGAGFDLKYYRTSLDLLATDGIGGTLREYPVPAVVVLTAPYALLSLVDGTSAYALLFILLATALDGAFLRAIGSDPRRAGQPERWGVSAAEWAWLAAVPAIGSIAFARFDLLPGTLVGLTLLLLARAPLAAAVLAACATGVKLWPVLAVPALAAPPAGRARFLAAGAVSGAVLLAGSLVLGGWDRLVSPLQYQGERGLQIESVAATPAMVGWATDPTAFEVFYSEALSWDVEGPGVGVLLTASTVATALLALALVALWTLAWLRLRQLPDAGPAVVWLVLASVAAFVVSGKVLSPQYLLWLLPAAAAGLVVVDQGERARLGRWTAALLVAAVLTHVVFPHGYLELLEHSAWSATVVAVLVVRNALLVGLCGYALWRSLRVLTPPRRRPTGRAATPAS